MKLIRVTKGNFLFHLGKREKILLSQLLRLYPRIPPASFRLSRSNCVQANHAFSDPLWITLYAIWCSALGSKRVVGSSLSLGGFRLSGVLDPEGSLGGTTGTVAGAGGLGTGERVYR